MSRRLPLAGLPRRILASRLLFAGLVAINLAIGAICTINSLQWLERPFPGFPLNQRMLVGGMS